MKDRNRKKKNNKIATKYHEGNEWGYITRQIRCGTTLSWAIREGPAKDPAEKLLKGEPRKAFGNLVSWSTEAARVAVGHGGGGGGKGSRPDDEGPWRPPQGSKAGLLH